MLSTASILWVQNYYYLHVHDRILRTRIRTGSCTPNKSSVTRQRGNLSNDAL